MVRAGAEVRRGTPGALVHHAISRRDLPRPGTLQELPSGGTLVLAHELPRPASKPIRPRERVFAPVPPPKGYGLEPKPRKWTRGGTARRKQQRAEAEAKHRVEWRARWKAEKAARLQRRVHKPAVAGLGAAPATDESPGREECP